MNCSNHHKYNILYIVALFSTIVTTLLIAGCSTKHNTWFSRGYQRMTSRYNVYFNGKEAFNSGIDNIRNKYTNDYSHVLPVYEFSNANAARAGQGDMETALKKSHKLVQLHSITVKPKRGEGPLSEEEKRFRAKEEFNKYVPEGYLLMGKANVVIHEEQEAIKYFDYLSRKHEGERPSYEAKIWKAIAYTQLGQYNEAAAALKSYDMGGVPPANLYADYQAAQANLLISQKQYAQAIPYIEHAAQETKDRHERRRYNYILAQLYRATGDNAKAAPIFLALSKSLQDSEMAFAAKIDLASVASTDEELLKAEKTLRKMLDDPKYAEQLDQVYYALGQMDLNKGDEESATGNFTMSANVSVSNDNQKGLSYLALADIYQPKPKYIDASTALDSAATYLDIANERKKEATDRANLLSPLAKELRTIRDNDSVMAIAKMSESDRNALIDNMVKEHNDRIEAERLAREADLENSMTQSEYYQVANATSNTNSSWYFYNTQLVAAGKSTFRSRWGNRKNEDDWRRSDKTTNMVAFSDEENATDEEAQENAEAQEAVKQAYSANSLWTREMLLSGIPLTTDAQKQKDAETEAAFLNSAALLYNDIQDYPSAIAQLQEMLRRYPKGSKEYDGLTLLHFAQAKNGDSAAQQQTDRKIVADYPNSLMAQNLSQPNFLASQQAKHDAIEAQYKQTYADYLTGANTSTISTASKALADNNTEDEYRPRYLLLRALAHAKNANTTDFRADLITLHDTYPSTPQDSVGQLLLAELDKGRNPVRATAYTSPLENTRLAAGQSAETPILEFAYEPDSAHIIVCLVDNGKLKEAQFKIADYNFTNFLLSDYDLEMRGLPNNMSAIIISPFADAKEATTYFYALRDQQFWKEIWSEALPQIYMISLNNYALLRQTGVDESFIEFFNSHYLNR